MRATLFQTRTALGVCLVLCGLGVSRLALGSDGTGLELSVAGDILGEFGNSSTRASQINRIDVREAEVVLYAPVDHLFDANLSLAAHREDAQAFFEIHEAYIGSSRLIPRSRFRLGQFFLGFGRLNQFHRHDWPFASAPKVHSEFFGFEAVSDTGIEYTWLTPLPFFLEITAGLTNGWVFGHSHNLGSKPLFPLHYVRAATAFELFQEGNAQLGLNYVGRNSSESTETRFLGLDFTAKWRENRRLSFLLQSEVWWRRTAPRASSTEDAVGMYLYPQWGISEGLNLGLRLETFAIVSRRNSFGASAPSWDWGVAPMVAYQASEFSTFRLAYHLKRSRADGRQTGQENYVEAQAVFILGSHPAHDF